ncbi:MAG: hypothetical protein KIH69_018655 [Anaerolineae bacterium]|nr:hypothetical protein [Anaerolineae bacterium]
MSWFEQITGFHEISPDQVRAKLKIEGEYLTSLVNGKTLRFGRLETPSLGELRQRVQNRPQPKGLLKIHEVVANVQQLHTAAENTGAFFQVASQFNLLEMTSPHITPEMGLARYEDDHTQGPACAIAAGAGTIYRNYFAPVGTQTGQIGQSATQQIDCLADLGAALGNAKHSLWAMQNGYALASAIGLRTISDHLQSLTEVERDALRQLLRIGLQWDTQVTLQGCAHVVTQAYCSALPVAYSNQPAHLWEDFARLVLEAAYEASLCGAILNQHRTGNPNAYFTLLGGGAFGNKTTWIMDSLRRALTQYRHWPINVIMVSYGRSNHAVSTLIDQFRSQSF